ncbi:hypothetical protein Tco_0275271, partial [Tanacetum coccineum]
DKFHKSIRSWRRREGLVVVDWRDLKRFSECVFSEIKPLLIQLTLIAPGFTVKANSIPEFYLVNWAGLRFFFIQIAVAFPNWHPSNLRDTICSSVRTGDAIAGACSALAIDS